MYGPLVAFLEKKLGKKIRLSSAPDGRSFLVKARGGDYDLLLPVLVVYYKLRPAGYRVIARGTPSFYGGAIVRNDSTIQTIDQLRGKKLAAIGEHSYGGYGFLLPLLAEKGIDPKRDVSFHFLEKTSIIVYGVINRKYDAGLLKLDTLDLPAYAGIRDELRVIARSAEIPQFPFVVKTSMDSTSVAAIQEALASLSPDRPEDLEILRSMQVERIVAATDADYDLFYNQVKNSEYLLQL